MSLPAIHASPILSSTVDRARRRLLLGGPALAGALLVPEAHAQLPANRWSAAWGCAPAGPPRPAQLQTFANQTLLLIVRASIGGGSVRVRVSNEMGSSSLEIGSAGIGLRRSGAVLVPGSSRQLRFGGRPDITIPAGAPAFSDPVALTVAPFADLAISLYLPGRTPASTLHNAAYQANYVSTPGNHAASASLPVGRAFASWPFLTEVDIAAGVPVLVAAGDSITDGVGSTSSANRRWTDWLARRFHTELGPNRVGVVNRGISANRMLADTPDTLIAGRALLERFDRDVLATSSVGVVAILIGINDIVYSPPSAPIRPEIMIAGYQQLIERAHVRGIAVMGATLPPMSGFVYSTPPREAVRQAVNAWMRSSAAFDLLLDADLALRDPAAPQRLRSAYDSGDHVHPNDTGYQALAGAVPLGQLALLLS
ncbi:GDSL-type esterase/lipase family protein [Massilia aurea]|uniref:GDSL-type esterase/lipase family protein n=1 Tax=Massilia aurea TaxID=373040 RepID=UPI00346275E1